MSGSPLPVELYRQIICDPVVTSKELLKLCLTSKDFAAEAIRLLYHSIDLDSRERTSLLSRTLLDSVQKPKLVFRMALRCRLEEEDAIVIIAINRMHNLQELYLFEALPLVWYLELRLPSIKVLHATNMDLVKPVLSAFGSLPDPLPFYSTQTVMVPQLDGIEYVRASTLSPVGSEAPVLLHLKGLEVKYLLAFYEGNIKWMPNLEILACPSNVDEAWMYDSFWWLPILDSFIHLRSAGPIFCEDLSPPLITRLASAKSLERVVLFMGINLPPTSTDEIICRVIADSSSLYEVFIAHEQDNKLLVKQWRRDSDNGPERTMTTVEEHDGDQVNFQWPHILRRILGLPYRDNRQFRKFDQPLTMTT